MSKQSGLGNCLWIDEFDMSGDVNSIGPLASPLAVQEVPGINRFAQERLGLRHDGNVQMTTYFNPDATAGAEGAHAILSSLPTADRLITSGLGLLAGAPAASMYAKQIDYGGTRAADGAFTFSVNGQLADGHVLDWGVFATAAPRTDTTDTSPASGVDLGASPTSYSQGWVAYLHVKDLDGTDADIEVQDSANGTDFLALTGGSAFATVTAPGKQRIESSSATATVRRYVRVVTTGTFTNLVFVVNFVRYEVARS